MTSSRSDGEPRRYDLTYDEQGHPSAVDGQGRLASPYDGRGDPNAKADILCVGAIDHQGERPVFIGWRRGGIGRYLPSDGSPERLGGYTLDELAAIREEHGEGPCFIEGGWR